MDKIIVIYCQTGCTCCSGENHYRGPYKSREDAERRIKYFINPDKVQNPLASQYARKGRYTIRELSCEEISNNRWIINSYNVLEVHDIIPVNEDGSISEGIIEELWDLGND